MGIVTVGFETGSGCVIIGPCRDFSRASLAVPSGRLSRVVVRLRILLARVVPLTFPGVDRGIVTQWHQDGPNYPSSPAKTPRFL